MLASTLPTMSVWHYYDRFPLDGNPYISLSLHFLKRPTIEELRLAIRTSNLIESEGREHLINGAEEALPFIHAVRVILNND